MKYPLAIAEQAKKVIKISGGGTRPLGGPRPLGPFDPSIIRRKGKKKLIKISAGGKKRRERALHHLITGSMSPRFPDLNSPLGKALLCYMLPLDDTIS